MVDMIIFVFHKILFEKDLKLEFSIFPLIDPIVNLLVTGSRVFSNSLKFL